MFSSVSLVMINRLALGSSARTPCDSDRPVIRYQNIPKTLSYVVPLKPRSGSR